MRVILHSDMNSFYASVEIMRNPALRGKPVVVCGETAERHGIVLAKSEEAKRRGVKTGMANWEARELCPGLIPVAPHYEQYVKYSRLARSIYRRYTDLVEPFGMDECWLDVTASRCFGDGVSLAEEIRRAVRRELGLTVSVGVSWNKIFAKLGSDMKKPDAMTVITPENFRETIWPLPVSALLYCGPATTRKLRGYGVHTIGELAARPEAFVRALLGKNGVLLRRYAAGLEDEPVRAAGTHPPVYSVGRGITCTADLTRTEAVADVLAELSQDVGARLRKFHAMAGGIELGLRGAGLGFRTLRAPMETPVQSAVFLTDAAIRLFSRKWNWAEPVRAVTLRAVRLLPEDAVRPVSLFSDPARLEKWERAERAVDEIRRMFGKKAIRPASSLADIKMPDDGRDLVVLPGRRSNA